MQATTIVSNFNYPVDTYLDNNILYVIEYAYSGNGRLFAVTLPLATSRIFGSDKNEVVKVFPNPAGDNFTIDIPPHLANAQIRLLDVLGQEYAGKESSYGKTSLDVTGLPRGIYFIEVSTGVQHYTQKIILQ
jgi:hypothetical protein